MPAPRSLTASVARSPWRPSAIEIGPSDAENLTALVIRLQTTCVSRIVSPSAHTGPSGSATSGRPRRPCSTGSTSSMAPATTSRRSIRAVQLDLSRGDARDVEHVVDHAREVRHLSLDDAALAAFVGAVAARHHLERSDDRRQRVTQLVAGHGEERRRAGRRRGVEQRHASRRGEQHGAPPGREARTRRADSYASAKSTSSAVPSGSVRASDCNADTVRRSSVSTAVARARDDCPA